MSKQSTIIAAAVLAAMSAAAAHAAPVPLASATATYSQSDRPWLASEMIDGVTTSPNGWAIFRFQGDDPTLSETALFIPGAPLAAGTYDLSFGIIQTHGTAHILGDFGFAFTTDAAPTLLSAQTAVSLSGGSSANGTVLSFPGAGRVLASNLSQTDIYTIEGSITSASAITGFFLNVYDDAGANGLPTGGPGGAANGNFVVTELTIDASAANAVPEPTSWALMILGFAAAGAALRSRRRAVAIA